MLSCTVTAVSQEPPVPAVEAQNADVIGAVLTGVLVTVLALVFIVDILSFVVNIRHYII